MEDGNLFGSELYRVSAGWKLSNCSIRTELLILTVECFNCGWIWKLRFTVFPKLLTQNQMDL